MSGINLKDKFDKITEHWKPRVIARVNDYDIRLAKIKGEFIWHKHDDTDELFLVNKGQLILHYRDKTITLNEGELHVVPKGVEHKPEAIQECEILMFEPSETVNTGNAGGDRTAALGDWI